MTSPIGRPVLGSESIPFGYPKAARLFFYDAQKFLIFFERFNIGFS